MIDTKLIMLEGLPATGKTTNSQFLGMQLAYNGIKAAWIHEVASPHPVLFFDEDDLWGMPLGAYKNIALEKWAAFAEEALRNDEVIILDSAVFQAQIFWFLLQNEPYKNLESFVHRLFDIVRPLHPSLIYFYREDTEATIAYLEKGRGTQFFAGIWERDRPTPYYQDKPAGAEGFKCFLRAYARWAKSLFISVVCQKAAFEVSEGWARCKDEMLSFLGIEHMPSPEGFPQGGVYKNEVLGLEMQVDGLTMVDPVGTARRLIPKSGYEFYVERLPVVLSFETPGQLTTSGAQICERWTTTGLVYKKLENIP